MNKIDGAIGKAIVSHEGTIGIRAELFNMQRRMLEAMAGGADLSEVLCTLCNEVEEWWKPREVRAAVLLVRNERLRLGVGPRFNQDFLKRVDGIKRGPNAGSCGTAAFTGKPVIVTDTSTDVRWADFRDLAEEFQIEACWAFPVFDRRLDDTIATIAIHLERDVEPTETEYKLLEGLSDVSGLIINRAIMEQQLAYQSMKLQHVITGTQTGIWEWSGELDEFHFDDQIVQMLGHTRDSLAIADLADVYKQVHPEDRQPLVTAIRKHLAGETDFFEAEFRFKHQSDDWVWLRDRGRITSRKPDGSPERVLGTIQDITRQREDEERLRRMQRLESLGRLAGGIAHDFNNIMVGIFGSISLAREEIEPGSIAYEDLALAEESLERARLLTGQLLTFAKGGEPVKTEIELAELVRKIVRFDLSGSAIAPVLEAPDDLWLVSADKAQLQQVFSNLVMNARDAMENEGKIFIHFENWRGSLEGDADESNYVKVSVRDTGPGIPPETISEIFDPYFSTKEDGTGLGLSTVHSIVNRHEGALNVESKDGEGATFTLFLPALANTKGRGKDTTRSIRDIEAHGPFRILVLDDEPSVRRTVIRMIESLGHDCVGVSDGAAAIDSYASALQEGKPYDAALLDLTISGGMGGHDACKAILALDPNARLIASSGYADNTILANYADSGFANIAPKPYTIDELDEVFYEVLVLGEDEPDETAP